MQARQMQARQMQARQMRMTPNARILIVHDDPSAGQALTGCLQDMGHTVCAVVSSDGQAVEEAADRGPGLALIDLEQDARGIGAAERIAGRSGAPVVYLVGDVDEDVLERARTTGPSGYVLKPFADRQLRLSIDAALALHEQVGASRKQQRQAAEKADSLSRQTHVVETVLNNVADGVVATDEHGQFTFFNTAAERIVGMRPTRVPSDQWSDKYGLFRADQVTPFPVDELPPARALRGEAVDDVELFVRNPERPEGIYVTSSSRPLRDADGVLRGGVTVFRDVTRLRETEQRLRQTAEQLQIQNRLMEAVFRAHGRRRGGSRPDRKACRLQSRCHAHTRHRGSRRQDRRMAAAPLPLPGRRRDAPAARGLSARERHARQRGA